MTKPTEPGCGSPPTDGKMPCRFQRPCVALAALLIFLLFYLGSKPFAAGLIPDPWDKLAHLVVYSAMTALLWFGTRGRLPLAVIIAVLAIGGLDEWHQAGIPGRVADVLDFLTDAGAALGTVLLLQLR